MYLIDFDNLIESNLSPDKREPKTVQFLTTCADTIKNLYVQTTQTYKFQSSVSNWSAGSYSINDLVRYGKVIYQAIKNTTLDPTNSSDWLIVSENFLGVDNRLKINGTKIVLERALNQWLGQVDGTIYIDTNIVESPVFLVGFTESECSQVFSNKSSELVSNSFTFVSQHNCTIFVPTAVHTAIGGDSIIRNFTDKYISSGITYNIQTY